MSECGILRKSQNKSNLVENQDGLIRGAELLLYYTVNHSVRCRPIFFINCVVEIYIFNVPARPQCGLHTSLARLVQVYPKTLFSSLTC
jgi:hypothetical protein